LLNWSITSTAKSILRRPSTRSTKSTNPLNHLQTFKTPSHLHKPSTTLTTKKKNISSTNHNLRQNLSHAIFHVQTLWDCSTPYDTLTARTYTSLLTTVPMYIFFFLFFSLLPFK
jgi:hypothetical protein